MKKRNLLMCVLAVCAVFYSCTYDDQEPMDSKKQKTETVAQLTEQLKVYDKQFQRDGDQSKRIKILGYKFSLLDCLKIGIADVKGAISGYKEGGTSQAVISACVASATKLVEILDKKSAEIDKSKPSDAILKKNGVMNFNDSVGFYHIASEKYLYNRCGQTIKNIQSIDLLCLSHSMMNQCSDGYKAANSFNSSSFSNMAAKLHALRILQDGKNDSYETYYEKVRSLDKEDSDYLDFASEYLYTALLGNVGDVKEYTNTVINQINRSNVASEDKIILTQSIYIAYSSVLFSNSIEIKE